MACWAILPAAAAQGQEVRAEQVRQSISSAVTWLKRDLTRAMEAGRENRAEWTYIAPDNWPGAEALAALALLNAGVATDDPVVVQALDRLAQTRDTVTYNISLKIAALAHADPVRYRDAIHTAAKKLARMQLNNGMWTYSSQDIRASVGGGDNSNTQFALYGLHEAARVGAPIEQNVWRRAAAHWERTQRPDGGWTYSPRHQQPAGYGSMTAAGVASLLICGESLNRSLEGPYTDGACARCGRYATNPRLAAGLKWLGRNFDARRNPNHHTYVYYWLYGVERVGMLSGLKQFGTHDWYREGAAYLVRAQRGDGSWNGSVVDTSFALLFLAKGRRPVLINKLLWADERQANLDRHDCENLTAFLGDRLGEPVAWQLIGLDADVEEWLGAPILYFQGHEFPPFTPSQRESIRKFVDNGGTLLAEACCSRPEFREGFERFAREVFPDEPLAPIDGGHPVWSVLFRVEPRAFPLMGIDVGCRTSVFYLPNDLSCLWEQVDLSHPLTEPALRLGGNIAAYATGRDALPDKLDTVKLLPQADDDETAAPPATAALRVAWLRHSGDWRTDSHALPRLAEYLRQNAGVDVVSQPAVLRADDPALLDHPIAYMTGHGAFRFTTTELDGLRRYLTRGGFLFADACCGREAFDRSFRKTAAELIPGRSLIELPTDHPLIRGEPGFDMRVVQYRDADVLPSENRRPPRLEAVTLEGRVCVVYSPEGFTCGLEDHACLKCRGLRTEDARKLVSNMVLYALSR
ncbi:MAG: DUF4159 domain-containing protein [Phycisphaerae bacterium]|nr:DUF4159 domain-containing protein [Phycisphaerae bacterium]NUQ46457.1 DUF4159 domain-containing protein [Phycisphaerae bacterium]